MPSAMVKFKPLSRRICWPTSTLVPSMRTTTGTCKCKSLAAATTPVARTSQRKMPPKILMKTALTSGSLMRMQKAFFTCSAEAPPPTSRQFAEFLVTEKRVVVKGHLGVEGDELAFASEHAGIDFQQRGVGINEGAVESLEEGRRGVHDFARQPQAERDFAGLVRLQTHGRMNHLAQNGAGIFPGDFLDFHAACGAGHEDDAAARAIDEEAEIKFALDVEAFFDEQALDDAAGGAGLRSDQLHAENVAGEIGGLVGGTRQLHAACFAAAACVNLGFNDDDSDVRPQTVRRFARFFSGEDDFTARSGDAVARQDRLGLVFMNLHRGFVFRLSLKQSASVRILTAIET